MSHNRTIPCNTYIGAAIRQCREDRSLSQTTLSLNSGIAQSVISRIETNGDPKFSTLWRFAHAFEMDTSELVKLAEEIQTRTETP